MGGTAGPSPAPAVTQRLSVWGDSWTAGNESAISRNGPATPVPEDVWPYQLAIAQTPPVSYFTLNVYSGGSANTPSGSTSNGVINGGYGGQTSGTIFRNLLNITGADTPRLDDVATWWCGRNDVLNPGGDRWHEVTIGTYNLVTAATLTNGSPNVTGVTLPTGELRGCLVTGAGIPAGTIINASTATTITLSANATATGPTTLTIQGRGADQFISTVPHARKLLIAPYSGSAAGAAGSVSPNAPYIRAKYIQMHYRRQHRAHLWEDRRWWRALSPFGSDGTAANNDLVAADGVPQNMFASAATDQGHPNFLAQPLIQAGLLGPVEACQNKRVWVLDQCIPDVPYDMAEGQTIEVYFKGFVTSCSIATDDPNVPGLFTIGMKPGSNDTALLTRTNVSPGNIPRVLYLQVTANGVDTSGTSRTHTGEVRILPSAVGAASSLPVGYTLPRDPNPTATSRRWPLRAMPAGIFPANRRKLSIVFRGKVSEDGTTMTLVSQGTNRVLLQRTTANRFAFAIRDPANTIIINWTSTTAATFNIAAGTFTLMASIDMDAAVARLWANIGGSDVDIAIGQPAPVVSGPSQFIDCTGHAHWFATSNNAQVTWAGAEQFFWMADEYIDFSSATERRKFVGATGALVDLGANGSATTGIVPEVYFRGAPGDYWTGRNFGVPALAGNTDAASNDPWQSGFAVNTFELTPY